MSKPNLENVLAVSVGNSNTRFAVFQESSGADPVMIDAVPTGDAKGAADRIARAAGTLPEGGSGVMIASVNEPFAEELLHELISRLDHEYFKFGRDLEVPMPHTLGERSTVGQDRLLAALAAFDTVKQACVVVDAGTAVTVDFVDGTGVFQGGVIAPGARMQLEALHRGTAALPEVKYERPEDAPFTTKTDQAMLQGVHHGIRGLVRTMVERYSESYGAFPLVIATGGDAERLFGDDEFVNRVVPDLVLRGINVARRMFLDEEDE
ncbi:MAG TPA: type III pantothenate kinase [Phycisphaerales bacterium]|nr:type III pantothenate kinase [Phycisphaerales bacterium]